jgi:hypothetical protein
MPPEVESRIIEAYNNLLEHDTTELDSNGKKYANRVICGDAYKNLRKLPNNSIDLGFFSGRFTGRFKVKFEGIHFEYSS